MLWFYLFYIFQLHIFVNFDFKFYYPRINKDIHTYISIFKRGAHLFQQAAAFLRRAYAYLNKRPRVLNFLQYKKKTIVQISHGSYSYIFICIRKFFIRTRTLFLSKLKEQAKTKSRLNHLSHNERRALLKTLDRINSQISHFTLPSLTHTLLFGNSCFSGETNTQILDVTIDYILSTNSLDEPLF